jgi:hypothetical protein
MLRRNFMRLLGLGAVGAALPGKVESPLTQVSMQYQPKPITEFLFLDGGTDTYIYRTASRYSASSDVRKKSRSLLVRPRA